jgi:hypothetical protein
LEEASTFVRAIGVFSMWRLCFIRFEVEGSVCSQQLRQMMLNLYF